MMGGHKKAHSLLLLTPNCDKKDTFRANYKPIFGLKKSVHVVLSKDDPYCDVDQIYEGMRGLNKKFVTLHTLSGDHNFKLTNSISKLNVEAALESSLNWLSLQL